MLNPINMFSPISSLNKTTVVLYHDECTDGFGAAYAAWTVLKDSVRYIPVRHGKPFPKNLENEHVLVLDFCYPRSITEQLQAITASLTVIDHHSTGYKSCRDLEGCYFDLSHSGAVLAWMHFHPDTPVPDLFRFIEDSDMERFALEETAPVIQALRQHPFSFEAWAQLLADPQLVPKLFAEGKLLVAALEHSAALIAKTASPVCIDGVRGLCASTSWEFAGCAAAEMAKRSGSFGVAWYHEGESVRCSWRSVDGVDVEHLSGLVGGGGHPHSAGSHHSEKTFWALLDNMRGAAKAAAFHA